MKSIKALQVLEEMLINQAYIFVSVGDWWRLAFSNGLWLISQEISSSNDYALKALLEKADPPVLNGVDPEYVLQSVAIFRNMRKPIKKVTLEDDGTLILFFDEAWQLRLTTRTEIVDWQWCLNGTGEDPYTDSIVACFASENLEVK
ncbi:MAG: hypothetical protein QNK37_32905 [Acidobacteriota bacterium]|nr:hypothetical protein [Acidobacteriota bacterium]